MVAPSSARAAPKAVIVSQSDDASGTTAKSPVAAFVAAPAAIGAAGRRADLALVGAAAFDRCLKQPAIWRDGPFALHLAWQAAVTAPPSEPFWRLGFVIPKRYEASAVARNTIKRRWRAAFRHGRVAWANEFGSADLVVRLQAPLVKKPAVEPRRKRDGAKEATTTIVRLPPRVRARDRFEPDAAFERLVERLRGRSRSRPCIRSVTHRATSVRAADLERPVVTPS